MSSGASASIVAPPTAAGAGASGAFRDVAPAVAGGMKKRNFQPSSLELAAALRSGCRNDVSGPGRRGRCGAGCVSALGPAGTCDPPAAWRDTRGSGSVDPDQCAPGAGLRKLQSHRSLRCETSPNFGPRGYCRGDFFARWRGGQRPLPAARPSASCSAPPCPARSLLGVAPGLIRRLLRCRKSAPVWRPAARSKEIPDYRVSGV